MIYPLNATGNTSKIDANITKMDDTHANISTPDSQPAPTKTTTQTDTSSFEEEPKPVISLRTASKSAHSMANPTEKVKVNFIISHTPEVASGVIEAVYKELSRANDNLELRQTPQGSYMRINGLAKNIKEYINLVQDVAKDLISNDSIKGSNVFMEPPVEIDSTTQVLLYTNPVSGEVRPMLQPGQDAVAGLQLLETPEQYKAKLTDYLYKSLIKAGRLKLSLTLRVYLGQFILRKYPKSKEVYGYNDFHTILKNPRASGWLKNWIGDETLAKRVLGFVRNSTNGPFKPIGNQAAVAADVLPQYSLEMRSEGTKFDVPIRKRTGERSRGTIICQLYRVTSSKLDANPAEANIYNLSLGKNLDWQLEGIEKDKGAKTFPEVTQYLRSAKAELLNSERPHDLNVYPSVKLEPFIAVESKIKYVAVKTIYQFRWKATTYIVEIAVNHRWDSINAMRAKAVPKIELGISIFGEDWEEEDDMVGNVWGDELEYILEGPRGETTPKGPDRVDHFLRTIGNIRDALEHLF
ncbi:hypothetical protein GL218_05044 [Daldinia childiae]|uniref:uncharacterized protein n=1 Tax=Daldinia childiae TaxID=326645 RepID=UPI001446297F|nr:uncharacterized protein GL218_05044 [Daldinia childiae]KAF3060045.1 hypothetical protein GL218_05044 [Daldinia childiae]